MNMIEVKDEVLVGEARYRATDGNGNILMENFTLEMITAIAQAGTPLNKVLFDSIKSEFMSVYAKLAKIPAGLICMWSGTTIPEGWYLCDGANGTPDLRDRFIVGSGSSYQIDDTGGLNSVSLNVENLASHSHTTNIGTDEANYEMNTGLYIEPDNTNISVSLSDRLNNAMSIIPTSSTGSSTPHENRPPYYALAFIMKAPEESEVA